MSSRVIGVPDRRSLGLEVALAVVVAVALLGPALGPGVVVAYDMPWSPQPRLTPFALGLGTPAPRAVPGDALNSVLGMALGASLAQKALLVGLLVACGLGAARCLGDLVPDAGVGARSVAVVAAIWNPYVAERLVIGQWVVVLGLAALPWVVSGLLRLQRGGSPSPVILPLVAAGLGGVNPWVVTALVALPAAVLLRASRRDRLAIVFVTLGMAAVWALPALAAGVRGAAAGARAFAPVSDTPYGTVISLLSGGGFWNTASHPAARAQPVLAAAATVLAAVGVVLGARALGRRSGRLLAAVCIGPLGAFTSVVPGLAEGWDAWVGLPGMAPLRDSQKLVAPLVVLAAVGLGVVVATVRRARWSAAAGGVAVTMALLQVAVLPSMAWGLGGRLDAVHVPDSLLRAAQVAGRGENVLVGVLPWNQYRRYPWNGARISLSLMPRMVDAVTVYDDSLPLRSGVIPGEDVRAAAVSARIAGGADPADALRAEGVGVVVVERSAGLEHDVVPGEVLFESADVSVIALSGSRTVTPVPGALAAGWAITLGTVLAVVLVGARVVWRNLNSAEDPLLPSGS